MKRIMTYAMLFINKLKQNRSIKVQKVRLKEDLLDVKKIHNAEKMFMKLAQEGFTWSRYQKYQEVLLK